MNFKPFISGLLFLSHCWVSQGLLLMIRIFLGFFEAASAPSILEGRLNLDCPLVREIEVETCMLKLVDTLKYICVYIYICIYYIRKAFYMCIHIYIYLNGSSQNHDRELSPFLPESFSDFRLKTKTK